jgi:hypothetical protein
MFLSPDWGEQFHDVSLRGLPRLLSDHFPLLLDCNVAVKSSLYFKFENICLKIESFVE